MITLALAILLVLGLWVGVGLVAHGGMLKDKLLVDTPSNAVCSALFGFYAFYIWQNHRAKTQTVK